MNRLSTPALAAYGLLGMPLAMVALPLYVHAPKFYGDTLGVPLAAVGVALLAARGWDAIQDPLIGMWSDRWRARPGGRWLFVALGTLPLALGMIALFSPPARSPAFLATWLAAVLLLVYSAYSLVQVSYQAHGAELARDVTERTRVTAWREGFSLIGVLVAVIVPEFLKRELGEGAALGCFAWGFAAVIVACAAVSITASPRVPRTSHARGGSLFTPLRNARFRALAMAFLCNGIAAAIPATLVLFYIDDVLRAPALAAAFLVTYFVAGAAGLPLWVHLARRYGKSTAWLLAMVLSVAGFAWAFEIGPAQPHAFFAVCALSGLALGADMVLPPSMLADVIDRDEARGIARQEGAYFGIWNFLTKANLAIAAGVSLPLLAALGYVPHGQGEDGTRALAAVYAVVPSVLKVIAIALLFRARTLERTTAP